MKIAIVGATGLVGTNIINLCEQYFDIDVEYSLFASKSSEGKKISINDKEITDTLCMKLARLAGRTTDTMYG